MKKEKGKTLDLPMNLPEESKGTTLLSIASTTKGIPSEWEHLDHETGGVEYEWDPASPGEKMAGTVLRINTMSLGGRAYVIGASPNYTDPYAKPETPVLLKRGGRVLEARMDELEVKVGDVVGIQYNGQAPAKEGLNPARLWTVFKFKRI